MVADKPSPTLTTDERTALDMLAEILARHLLEHHKEELVSYNEPKEHTHASGSDLRAV